MTEPQKITLSLIVPAFNESDTVELFVDKVRQVFTPYPDISLELLFVNDGSTDATLNVLLSLQQNDPRITIVDLSRNFGKEAALTAGLEAASGDIVVPIDADLQHPPEVIPEMIAKWREGYEVVLGRRTALTAIPILGQKGAPHNGFTDCIITSPNQNSQKTLAISG